MSDFNDIVFAGRNKLYGAYTLRKKYNRTVIISIFLGIIVMLFAVIYPYLRSMAFYSRKGHEVRQVEIKMEKLDQPAEVISAPPPPPPPKEIIQQTRYIPPVVVDSVKRGEETQLMTADDAKTQVTNEEAVEVVDKVREEVPEQTIEEPFVAVEEMPVPEGGPEGLHKFISDKTRYPAIARENNIQGKVYVKFCVTAKGTVDQVSILKSVDPELDAEAMRVVKSFPPFTPGKQGGRPVPVWLIVNIDFKLD